MKTFGKDLIKLAGQQKATVAIIIMLIFMAFPDTAFYTPFNLFDLLSAVSINLIVAGGVTLVIICAGCDLSVGGVWYSPDIIDKRLSPR
jgi:ribose transport system permease protein